MLKHKHDSYKGEPFKCPCSPICFRWFILYHWFPYDKSIFGKIRDPVWWIIKLVTMIPMYCVRPFFYFFIFILMTLGTPKGQRGPDEFQMITFILSFKGVQFITGGILGSIRGWFQYYLCIQMGTCSTDWPGRVDGIYFVIVEFFLNVFLSWWAFGWLPMSGKYGEPELLSKKWERLHRK